MRRLSLTANHVVPEGSEPTRKKPQQLDLFTDYEALEKKEQEDGTVRSLVEIHLHTGRHHQIRVQFAAHGTPLMGDTKYGAPAAASVGRARREPLALCAVRLSFLHPVTGKRMEFSTKPQFVL